ncbi:MFS transporter [Saccharopolyspora shandongensis]|uniref:Sugar transporter n=1 Tax=Saccharopolyspora shandongensis TaxID=418495 RepID=A0A1H3RC51_9PSEU|nr:MFS transporter [Saccharopolyspora shandongensis]SDZ23324.1 Sugar transporter [Saccharopolyspora shandongensis]
MPTDLSDRTNDPEQQRLSPPAKRAVKGACFGFFVDYFDIYLPVVALTPAIAYFQAQHTPASVAATLSYVTLALTLIGRPVGAIIFGRIADITGRRRATLIAVAGAGACTLLMGLLPGYATIGWLSIILVLLLRFVGGVFMGGEYSSANPLAMEASPKRLRGLVGGMIAASYPLGYIAISIVVAITFQFAPAGSPDSPYVQWGWRIPFFVGAALSAWFLLYYRKVEESAAFKRVQGAEKPKSPLRELLTGEHRRKLLQVLLLMTGMWFTVQATLSATPALLSAVIGLPSTEVNTGLLVANVFVAVGYLVMAQLGQRFGRRRMLVLSGIWTVLLAPLAFVAMVREAIGAAAGDGSTLLVMVYATAALVLTVSPWGIVSTYIIERFATGVRASGYGIGYSLAVIIPGFYAFYMLGLTRLMPYEYTPIVLIVLGGVLTAIGALRGPETRDADLD